MFSANWINYAAVAIEREIKVHRPERTHGCETLPIYERLSKTTHVNNTS